jgi:hypothetical protein
MLMTTEELLLEIKMLREENNELLEIVYLFYDGYEYTFN